MKLRLVTVDIATNKPAATYLHGDSNFMQTNPYAYQASSLPASDLNKHLGDPEHQRLVEIRQKHITYESSLRSTGVMYVGGATLMAINAVAQFIGTATLASKNGMPRVLEAVFPQLATWTLVLILAIVQGKIGINIARLDGRYRIPAIGISILWLFSIFGILPAIGFLCALSFPKGKYVLTHDYKQVIAQTPEVRIKTSAVSWIVLVVFIILLTLTIYFTLQLA